MSGGDGATTPTDWGGIIIVIFLIALMAILIIAFVGTDQEMDRCLQAGHHWLQIDGHTQCVNLPVGNG